MKRGKLYNNRMESIKTVFRKRTQFQILLMAFFFVGMVSYSQNGCPQVPISNLNGINGFSIEGKSSGDDLGQTIRSAGDLNHDGIADILIGAPSVDFGGLKDVGEIYVIFGKAGLSINPFDISTLDGTNGFVIRGVVANEKLGSTINTAGDLNNDGIDDIIIGSKSGVHSIAYVIYGAASSFLPLYTTTDLNASNNVALMADSSINTRIIDVSKAGDLNHDGIDDVIVSVDGGFYFHFYIVFGKTGLSNLNSSNLDGLNGFVIGGYSATFLGTGVTGRNAGDINNDGIDDLIFGIPIFSETGFDRSGRAVIWYGKSSLYNALYSLNTMTAADGTIITGSANYEIVGGSVSAAGDFNKDGIDDVIIGAPGKVINGLTGVGEAYVLFGRNTPFPSTFASTTLNATTAIIFQGKIANENFGNKVNFLRDINNDSKDDIIIAARREGKANNGAAYVVFGGTVATGTINSSDILGMKGYQVFNDESYYSFYNFGIDVSGIGDFNNDGANDFAVGSIGTNSVYNIKGKAYVFYGEKTDRKDAVKPVINCPSGMELYANSTLPNYVHTLGTISDNCTDINDLVFTQNPPEGTLFTADTNVTIIVKDESGNTNSCSFLVKLKTNTPVFDCRTPYLKTTDLNGIIGFTVYGEKAAGGAGSSVNTAGDVNGDGITDFIIGAPGTYDSSSGQYHNIYRTINGAGYVVYGTASGFPPNVDLALLNGTNGFIIRNDLPQTNFPVTGYDVSAAGDINGDGIGDFMISDPYRHTSYGNEVGHVYVVFGNAGGFPAEFLLSSLNGSNGFALIGTAGYSAVGINITKLGDINGDGIDDLGTIDNGNAWQAGNVFVIYGSHSAFPVVLRTDKINGANGFIIKGDAIAGTTGKQISGLGDVNGDGISDIGIGTGDDSPAIRKFVVFGRSSNFPASFSTLELNGTNGFAIENSVEPLFESVGIDTAGDVNGDGINDIAITGSYILFGKNSFPALVDLKNLNGTNGTKFLNNGFSEVFSGGGDFNHDGFDDFLYRFGNGFAIYYGKSTWTATIDINTLTEKDCMRMYSFFPDALNFVGDINHDGIDDVIVGKAMKYYSIAPNYQPGYSYVIFGKKIEDTEKPVIANCPSNQNLNIGDAIPDYKTVITVTDNCDTNPLIEQTPLPGTIYTGGTQTITLKATDAQTNSKTCTFNIVSGGDILPPVIICPGDQQLDCGALLPNYLTLLNVSDDKDLNIDATQFPGAGSTFFDGMEIKFTATDDAGNVSNCRIFIHVSGADTEAPTFTCPTNVTLNCGDLIPNYALDPAMNLDDNCSENIDYVMTPASGTPFYDGIPIHIEYTDESGNMSVCNFIVHNANPDNTQPVINCIGNQILNCSNVVPDYTGLITATDNCDAHLVIAQSPIAGTVFISGMTITMTATDASNNYAKCSFIVSASADVIKPLITCIGNQTLNCGNVVPDYTSLITVTDNCDTHPVITQSPIAGSVFTSGMTITMRATDASNNYAQCSFIVNASADVIKPSITCIGNQSLICGSVLPDYTGLMTVTDNCDADPVITQSPVAGSIFTSGMTITMTVTDASGNYGDCSFTVNAFPDTMAPAIICLGDQSLACSTAIPDYTGLITATDNCDTNLVITQSPTAGSNFVDGMTITITVTDVSGNYANCSFIVNASTDVAKPSITCVGNQTLNCGSILPDYTGLINVADNCDPHPVIMQSPIAGTVFTSGMTITMTAKDASNNYAQCSFIVSTSADITKPLITCIGNQTLNCGSVLPDYTGLITVTDNCDAHPIIRQSPVAGSVFVDGMTITMTVTDVSGNYANCSFIVNASTDVIIPVINCIGDQQLSCGSTIPDYTPLVTANDNCDSSPIIMQSPAVGSVFISGMIITMTAKDVSNNYIQCSFVVNASEDLTKPSIICIGDQNLNFEEVLPDYRSMIIVTDNCDSNLTVIQTPSPGTAVTDGMIVVMSTVDNSGNMASCSFLIHIVVDKQKPVFNCLTNQLLACKTKLIPDYTKMITAIDNIDPNPVITQTPAAGSLFIEGMNVEIQVADKSNNISKCSFQLNVNPVLVDAGEDQEITEGQSVQLDAIALENGSYSWTPSKGLNSSKIANPVIFPTETTTFTVIFKNILGCEATDQVTITVFPLDKDETKYGFSPNNDGINDFWVIDDITQYPKNQVLIYSRWGDLVFQIENYNNTTNVFNGIANKSRGLGANELPEGTYFFEIRVDQPHHFKKLKGYLVLKR